MLPAVKVGGICICMKGSNAENEINDVNISIDDNVDSSFFIQNYPLVFNRRICIIREYS